MSRRRPGTSRTFESSETVMDAILALDDLYQAGELPGGLSSPAPCRAEGTSSRATSKSGE